MTPTPTYSRFQAIISAKPGTDPLPPPVQNSQFPRYSYDSWPGVLDNRKRKRQSYDTEPRNINKALQRAMENEQTVQYKDRQHLIEGLRERFKQGPEVDFHGYYETPDPGVTHKQRIQTITHEIWKATGYRFTVKDHPHIKDGHKTRFWCSQDGAHRSKSSRMAPKPRVLSGGEVMAKTRYPCRSRLLISSRDAETPGQRIITVRMHHHVAHEPYVDSSLPPEVAQTIWESFGWLNGGFVAANNTRHSSVDKNDASDGGLDSDVEGVESASLVEVNGHVDLHSGQAIRAVPSLIPQIPAELTLEEQEYQQRMKMHIRNIREFCDGLEYQLHSMTFGSFLQFVEDCLRKEGRLSSADGSDAASSSGLTVIV
ncbi:hypothetical protein BDQ17DRAFT_1388962 [Cyathus striatus]|nr:hypothetical protein BDQ17DRAFT_1388962 [Cyathus striatus]